jgi:hypothetical protein
MVFETDSLAQEAITGLYIKLMSNNTFLLNGGLSIYAGQSSDELVRTTFRVEDDQFAKNGLATTNNVISNNFWKPAYIYIYQANACLEGLSNSTKLSPDVKSRLTGEAKFIRAFCYWYLTQLFGDVPLTTTSDVNVNVMIARSPASEVRAQVIKDLQEAWSVLPVNNSNTVPGKSAAAAFLARVYCYEKDWVKSETFASSVIDPGRFSLPSLANVFVSSSPEIIYQVAPVLPNNSTAEGNAFVPFSPVAAPAYAMTDSLVQAFTAGDARKDIWTKKVTVGTKTYYYPYKYKINTTTATATEYNIAFRLGEKYLVRAEARAQQNNLTGAVEDINVIRVRAGLPALQGISTMDDCLMAIEKERRVELFAEWGHRWFDLKRTTRIHAVLQSAKGNNWQATDQLYPIPLSEIQRDPNLTQNQGY